jgi:hypothetical protein
MGLFDISGAFEPAPPPHILAVAFEDHQTGHGAGSNKATWRSGDAADCKSVYPGSIPGVASKRFAN